MSRVVTIPAETDLLCEGCGYVLNGLPDGALCPECGKPSDESSPILRHPPSWEKRPDARRGPVGPFLHTTAGILFRPTCFFRSLTLRPEGKASLRFAQVHWAVTSLLFAITAGAHWHWYTTLGGTSPSSPVAGSIWTPLALIVAWSVAFLLLVLVTRVMAWVTTWEAAYRGLRLPLPTVLRGLHYHAPHYLPVALIAAATVLGYQALLRFGNTGGSSAATYLYVLCGEVVLSAAYLFTTYWTAMRNLMYANR